MSGRLLGYPEVTKRLQRELAEGHVSHAYLVLGPTQVGKKVLALELAQALNCLDPSPPCGLCPHCQKIIAGIHPDVQVLGLLADEKSNRLRKEIGIDQVRALQHDASLHPCWGRYRVFVIDEAQHLSCEAANCLLKTLEEPPSACIIILLATEE
ncbi:MAG: DNA polymerase III subunit delta', partial [Dehalococcoidia bacterium]|nr:DNA polymerase III subunit delta' [Dehalococcoidia bacterium]